MTTEKRFRISYFIKLIVLFRIYEFQGSLCWRNKIPFNRFFFLFQKLMWNIWKSMKFPSQLTGISEVFKNLLKFRSLCSWSKKFRAPGVKKVHWITALCLFMHKYCYLNIIHVLVLRLVLSHYFQNKNPVYENVMSKIPKSGIKITSAGKPKNFHFRLFLTRKTDVSA